MKVYCCFGDGKYIESYFKFQTAISVFQHVFDKKISQSNSVPEIQQSNNINKNDQSERSLVLPGSLALSNVQVSLRFVGDYQTTVMEVIVNAVDSD